MASVRLVTPAPWAAPAAAGSDAPPASGADDLARLAYVGRSLVRAEAALVATIANGVLLIRATSGIPAASPGAADLARLAFIAEALRDDRVRIMNRLTAEQRHDLLAATGLRVRQLIAAPIGCDGEPAGMLLCINPAAATFTDDDGGALDALARLAADVVGAESRPHHERRGERESRVLVDLVHQLNETLDLPHVASLVATDAVRLLEARGAVVTLREGDHLFAIAAAGEARTELGRRVPIASTISGEALRLGHAVRSRNVFWVPYWTTTHATLGDAPPNAVAVPLRAGDETIGAMMVYGSLTRDFSDHDAALLDALATHAGVALNNARLFEAQREAHALAEAAAALARAALEAPTLARTATAIVDIVSDAVQSAGVALGIRSDEGFLRCSAARGTLAWLVGHALPAADPEAGPAGEVRAPLSGVAHRPDTSAGADADTVESVPLLSGNRMIGVLVAAADGATTVTVRHAIAQLAEPVTLALEVAMRADLERQRAEREQLVASALATMDQPVFILDLERRIRYANGAAVGEYGYTVEELNQLSFDALVATSAPARRVESPHTAIPGSTWKAEQVHCRRDGSRFPAAVVLSYIRDAAGRVCGQVVHLRNLTDEHRLETQLRQSEKLAAIGELVAGVAHEVNNPLAGISALAELILEEPLSPELMESARLIKREADRASGVIRDLLAFARKPGANRAAVDLAEVVRLATRLRAFSLRRTDIRLELDLDPATPLVLGDAQHLQQVVLNLVMNAEYAMRASPHRRLTIRSAPAAGGALLAVTDTGAGMPLEVRQRVFEPFFTTKPAGQGTGLGLSVSYGIVQAHGGTITVDSEDGAGSTFTILLPAAADGAPIPFEL